MNAGELNERAQVLVLQQAGTDYSWTVEQVVWCKAEKTDKGNIFSSVGIAAKTVIFTIRRRALTLHNALRWNGRHCFITDIRQSDDRLFLIVTTAIVEPRSCSVKRTTTTFDEILKRPTESAPQLLTFPACLTEKYIGRVQSEPMNANEIRHVLVTPKVIDLRAGEVVTVAGFARPFTVLIPHDLDDFKNEYEIIGREEA